MLDQLRAMPGGVRIFLGYAFLVLGGMLLSTFAMERALITRDFTVRYVAQVGSWQLEARHGE